MKTNTGSIADFYALLVPQSEHRLQKIMMDRLLLISSPVKTLAQAFVSAFGSLNHGFIQEKDRITDGCIIDVATSHPEWKSLLESNIKRKIVHDGGIGELEAYEAKDGIVIVKPALGIVMIAETGEIVCLVNGETGPDRQPGLLNLFVFSQILMVELLARGQWTIVHSGCVGRNGKCLLITGPSGSGKTTLTLRLVSEGWDFYGDDQVVVGSGPDRCWKAWPYWRTVRASAETCRSLPHLRQLADRCSSAAEHQIDIKQFYPQKRPKPGIIDAIYFLNTNSEPALIRLNVTEAMQQLGQCFLYYTQDRYAERALNFLCDVSTVIPVYSLSRGMLNAEKIIFGTPHET